MQVGLHPSSAFIRLWLDDIRLQCHPRQVHKLSCEKPTIEGNRG